MSSNLSEFFFAFISASFFAFIFSLSLDQLFHLAAKIPCQQNPLL